MVMFRQSFQLILMHFREFILIVIHTLLPALVLKDLVWLNLMHLLLDMIFVIILPIIQILSVQLWILPVLTVKPTFDGRGLPVVQDVMICLDMLLHLQTRVM